MAHTETWSSHLSNHGLVSPPTEQELNLPRHTHSNQWPGTNHIPSFGQGNLSHDGSNKTYGRAGRGRRRSAAMAVHRVAAPADHRRDGACDSPLVDTAISGHVSLLGSVTYCFIQLVGHFKDQRSLHLAADRRIRVLPRRFQFVFGQDLKLGMAVPGIPS